MPPGTPRRGSSCDGRDVTSRPDIEVRDYATGLRGTRGAGGTHAAVTTADTPKESTVNTPKKLALACALVTLPLAACGDDDEVDDLDDIEVTVDDDGGAATTVGGDTGMPAMTTAPAGAAGTTIAP